MGKADFYSGIAPNLLNMYNLAEKSGEGSLLGSTPMSPTFLPGEYHRGNMAEKECLAE